MSFFFSFMLLIFLVVCLFLCLIIMIQEGKGGGLGASFGGGDSSDSLFGTSTPDILKKITGYLDIIFMVMCMLLSFWTSSIGRHHTEADSVPQEFIGE